MLNHSVRFCAILIAGALLFPVCTWAEEGGTTVSSALHHIKFDVRNWAKSLSSHSEELGLSTDQKSKLDALANSSAPKNQDENRQLAAKIEEVVKAFTPDQKEILHKHQAGEQHDRPANREDNDDHK